MDEVRFDRLARLVGSRASRRAALGALAAAGLGGALGVAGPDEASAKCSKKKPCGPCAKCKRGKCKKRKGVGVCADGGGACQGKKCICPPGRWLCEAAALCCDNGQDCDPATTSCRACPVVADVCEGSPVCGSTSPDEDDWCGCVTSVEGVTTCSDFAGACVACTSDADCVAELGVDAVCVDISGDCGICDNGVQTVCYPKGCPSGVASGTDARLRPAGRPKRKQSAS